MKKHHWVIITIVSAIYYALAWYLLLKTDAGLVATAAILFGFPSLLLGYYSYAPLPIIVSVSVFGAGAALILEGVAHVYGLWFTLGADVTRVLSLVPLEVIVATICEVIFLTFLYELIFDDGVYNQSNARTRYGAFAVFAFGLLFLVFLYTFAESQMFISYSYVWVIGTVLASSLAALSVYRVYTARFLDRLIHFSLIGAVPGLLALSLSVMNVHRVYANADQYLGSIAIKGEMIPIEAIILAFALPFFVATVYELYLDDRS